MQSASKTASLDTSYSTTNTKVTQSVRKATCYLNQRRNTQRNKQVQSPSARRCTRFHGPLHAYTSNKPLSAEQLNHISDYTTEGSHGGSVSAVSGPVVSNILYGLLAEFIMSIHCGPVQCTISFFCIYNGFHHGFVGQKGLIFLHGTSAKRNKNARYF